MEPPILQRLDVVLEPVGSADPHAVLVHVTAKQVPGLLALPAPVPIAVTLVADDGSGTFASMAIGDAGADLPLVDEGGTVTLTASIAALPFDLDNLAFAGKVEAIARVEGELASDPDFAESTVSSPLFFHPATPGDGSDQDIVWWQDVPPHRGDFRGVLLSPDELGDASGPVSDGVALLDRVVGQPKTHALPDDDDKSLVGPDDWTPLAVAPTPGQHLATPTSTHAQLETFCAQWTVSATDSGVMFRATPSVTPPPPSGTVPNPEPPEEDWGAETGNGSTRNGWSRPMAPWRARNAAFRMCERDAFGFCVLGPVQWLDQNGCATVSVELNRSYKLEIQSQMQDAGSNLWRVYEKWVSGTSVCPDMNTESPPAAICAATPPGLPRSITTVITFTGGGVQWVTVTGANQNHWSTTAFTASALYRQPNGLTNTTLSACLSGSSSSQAIDTNWTAGRACLAIGNGAQPRRKFLVAHEIGHAVGAMSAQDDFNGGAMDYDVEYERDHDPPAYESSNPLAELTYDDHCGPPTTNKDDRTPDFDPMRDYIDKDDDGRGDPGECYEPCRDYNLHSIEWDSIALREAWAHLYATRVMNDRARDAVFAWNSTPESSDPDQAGGLQKYSLDDDDDELLAVGKGRLHGVCCDPATAPATCDDDASTIRDWTGALWNFYASYWDEDCAGIDYVDWSDIIAIMDATLVTMGADDKTRAFDWFSTAVWDRWPGTPWACQRLTWQDQWTEFQLDN